ncbi:MAG: right-handed parallel beta-helix repeat-containing protein [Chloroflexi bacterium]|nr:right-handed parallel beta-helix repeat-containing protein [Chloroflexota bacterium]
MKNWAVFLFISIVVTGLGVAPQIGRAQTGVEPDTEAFISANFQLQDSYSNVLCVAQNGDCPGEISVAVPCFVADCSNAEQTYPVSETFDIIQDAAMAASPGDLIIIMPGRYRGVQVEEMGGEDGAYIHFLGWGDPGSVVVDGSADPEKSFLRHQFYFIDVHHYIVQNMAFEGAEDGAGIFFSGYFSNTGHFSHHIIVSNIYSHDNYEWGMHTTSTNYMLIQDSAFTNSEDEHGLYISGSGDNIVVRRNVFQGNPSAGLQINADPQTATGEVFYWLEMSTGDTCDWSEDDIDGTATWHDIKDCYDSQGLPDLGEFFEDGISENIIVEQNVMTNNGENGAAAINLASVQNSIIRNNLMYGNFAAGITCWDDGYAEWKELDSSEFGCQNVTIVNNTMVDEEGNRGALILNNDARNMTVANNIMIRDRFDAYEIANRSGEGLNSSNNYYFERYVDNAPGTPDDVDSISGFSVDEGFAQFVNPTFEPWILEDGMWFTLNPDRPDYHLVSDSVLVDSGNDEMMPVLDVLGNIRASNAIGALGSE